ncbi:MAG: glycosyltransferase family 4 protein [Terriglobales bacterium]
MVVYSFYESDTRVLQYAKTLAARGDIVDVIALRREGTPTFEVLDGVNVYRIQERKVNERSQLAYLFRILRFLLLSTLVLTKKHLAKRYDVIHIHSVPDFLVLAATVPKLAGARVILDIHDILPEFYASKFGVSANSLVFKTLLLVEKLSISFSDHVIIANHLWLDRLVSRSVKPEKCTSFLNYPDPAVFYPRSKGPANGRFLITYPGSLNPHQGVDIVIRAFALVADKMPEAELRIYGEGPAKPSLIRLRDELGLQSSVIFHESLPISEIAEVMARSDLAVVPKRASSAFGNEAASTKIMEFMSLGVPVIVSRTKIDTYYHNDSMVKFFESENESDLAYSMLLLRSNPKLRMQLASNASRHVQRHNWREKGQEYLDLVDMLASKVSPVRKREDQVTVMHQ